MTLTYWLVFLNLLGWMGVACVVFAVLGAAAGRWSR